MVKDMRYVVTFFALLLFNLLFGQVSISAGGSMLKGFGPTNPWGGFHIGVEIPRDDAISLYARYTHHFEQMSKELGQTGLRSTDPLATYPNLYPYVMNSMNYNMIEGGTRYYLGNGFDYGWGAYGGTNIMLVFNQVKDKYYLYDEIFSYYPAFDLESYEIDPEYRSAGSILSLGFGLQGGVKYSMVPFGTIYFDAGINYMIFAQGSTTYVYPNMFNQLIFTFNLGFRKDILW